MIRNMVTATNTMNQLQQQLDLISNNIANSATTGYKQTTANFNSLLHQQVQNQRDDQAPRMTPDGLRLGNGARISQSQLVGTQGSLQRTERDLDFAFSTENQYFKVLVQSPDGTSEQNFTRAGGFYLTPVNDDEVMLVDAQGNGILNQNDELIMLDGPVDSIQLQDNGTLLVESGGVQQAVELGIVDIQRPQLLDRVSSVYLGIPDNLAELGVEPGELMVQMEGGLRQNIGLEQGALEQSNVDLSKAFTELIEVQRNYQFHSRAVSISDQMSGLVNGLR
ncbi:flagellar hook-basal body protein [Jeotgalibacillus haloalkalitolerans]|uniref:Flagellar hook-basal body protein n=1 Tax=Jeotgalibacillus haloalkalitolerans TaxID=3104292 RepID=A0ABU5KJA9_9BACL|nr:flagellar hook-basal body protein [Jeotgalibacillus sp. HH7-29]MDZ5711265.1 flagellar hook-basal body protein [Jeotgalibacillus sp. HH7-29]